MKKFKYSYKQMWSFARKSQSYTKQAKWLRRIYDQKIKIAERKGELGRALYLRSIKSNVRTRLKANIFPIRKMDWTIATSLDIDALAVEGKVAKQGGMLIVEDVQGKVIAYEGTAIYDEIVEAKKQIYGENWEKTQAQILKEKE